MQRARRGSHDGMFTSVLQHVRRASAIEFVVFILAGLVFNEHKKECDYQGEEENLCVKPRSFLRSRPKAERASILFEGVDATGQFP
jgi:hypothetical protein